LKIGRKELTQLGSIAPSRTEAAARVARARMLLTYRDDPSFFAVGRALGVHHQTVQRCVERAIAHGVLAALEDSARPGREPVITVEARAWLVDLACRKAKDLGYPHEVWTTRLLAEHAREHGPSAAMPACLTWCKAPSARSSMQRRLSRTRCTTTWNVATRISPRRWRRCCASIAGSSC
jgi:transposase